MPTEVIKCIGCGRRQTPENKFGFVKWRNKDFCASCYLDINF